MNDDSNSAEIEHQRAIVETLRVAVESLITARGPSATLYCAARGLRLLAAAAFESGELYRLAPDIAGRGVEAIEQLAPVLADLCSHSIEPEDIYMAMGAASGLLKGCDDLRADRFDYVCIFADRLSIEIHSRSIRQRGDPLRRCIAIRRSVAAMPTSETVLH